MAKLKVWYGKKHCGDVVYKRFVSMTVEEAQNALNSIRATNSRDCKTDSGKQAIAQKRMNKRIVRDGQYLFLNLNQAEHLGLDRKHNTAIYVKVQKPKK